MKKALIFSLTALVFIGSPGSADEKIPAEDWENVEGVTVQPKERVDQINAYRKKLEEAEKKKLKEGWNQKGVKVQSDERVKHLNELHKARREKEVREIKCEMCTTRCTIVKDYGQAICRGSGTPADPGTCQKEAGNFLKSCLAQCEQCQPATARQR